MRKARLDEAQAGIKIPWRNVNNLRYADDTHLWQKVKRHMMNVKEESERVSLKLNIQKTNIMTSSPITSWQVDGNNGNSDFIFLGSKTTADVTAAMKLKDAWSLEEKLWPT